MKSTTLLWLLIAYAIGMAFGVQLGKEWERGGNDALMVEMTQAEADYWDEFKHSSGYVMTFHADELEAGL